MRNWLVAAALVGLMLGRHATAQQAQPFILLTWQAKSYTPPEYTGKALPTGRTSVTAAVTVVENGRVRNISGQTIRWYLEEELLQSGTGLDSLTFTTPEAVDESVFLRAELPDLEGETFLETVEIPVVSPEVVIESPFPGDRFATPTITLRALPFFFTAQNSSELNFLWNVNGQSPGEFENPEILTINVSREAPKDSRLEVNLTAKNQRRPLESDAARLDLFLK